MSDPNFYCRKCGIKEPADTICKTYGKVIRDQVHHLIPSYMSGKDEDGRRILCRKCHRVLHWLIESRIFFKHVPQGKKKECVEDIKKYSLEWINK